MNIMQILALLLGLGVTAVGLFLSTSDVMMFVDGTSIFIVLGGTLASTAISVRLPRIMKLLKIFINKMLKGKSVDFQDVIKQIIRLSDAFYSKKNLQEFKESLDDPFIGECIDLYTDELVDDERFIRMLRDRIINMKKALTLDVNRFKNIGKYPPAFGMMGTTMGMVVLLSGLGGKDAMKTMGPAMAVCLITTLYGVIVANVMIVPISENIEDSATEIHLKNTIIVEGFNLILEKTAPPILAEELNSFLEEKDRLDWKEVLSGC